jgi:hypothetical protein
MRALRINARQCVRLQKPQAGIRGGDQIAIVQAYTDVARRGMHIPAVEQRLADAADLLPVRYTGIRAG